MRDITRRWDAGYKDLPNMLGIPPLKPKGSLLLVYPVLYMADWMCFLYKCYTKNKYISSTTLFNM